MKVLVIEDKEMHRESARETLADHELTVAPSYDEGVKALGLGWPACEKSLEFDAVLTDMNLPMSKETLVSEVFNPDEQIPYGFVLAIAAAHRGARYVAMVTDTNHHRSAMSAALDKLAPSYYEWHHDSKYESDKPKVFSINGSRVVFVHTPFVKDFLKDQPCHWCKDHPGICGLCNGTGVRTDLKKGGEFLHKRNSRGLRELQGNPQVRPGGETAQGLG